LTGETPRAYVSNGCSAVPIGARRATRRIFDANTILAGACAARAAAPCTAFLPACGPHDVLRRRRRVEEASPDASTVAMIEPVSRIR
jgi:hypothetical protein